MEASPGLEIGVGGRPSILYVFQGVLFLNSLKSKPLPNLYFPRVIPYITLGIDTGCAVQEIAKSCTCPNHGKNDRVTELPYCTAVPVHVDRRTLGLTGVSESV